MEDIKYFFQEIGSRTLKDLEKKRKAFFYTEVVCSVVALLFVSCIVLIIAGLVYYGKEEFGGKFLPIYEKYFAHSTQLPWVLGFFIALLILLFFMFYLWLKQRYTNAFKDKINKKLFYHLNPNIKYNPKEYISEEDFKNSGLFQSFNNYTGNDHCLGAIKDYSLEFSEIKASMTRSSGEYGSSTTLLFHGLFTKLSLPSAWEGIYIVPEKEDVGGLFLKPRNINSFKGKKKWEAQTNFDQKFNVYCDNISQAQQYLTDEVKNNILNISHLLNKNIYLSIKNSCLYLAIECGAFFEPPVRKAIQIDEIKKSSEFFISFIDIVSSSLIPSFSKHSQ